MAPSLNEGSHRQYRHPGQAGTGACVGPSRGGTEARNAEQYSEKGGTKTMIYTVIFERSAKGGRERWYAYVPDLPGCDSVGETRAECEAKIRDEIEFHLENLHAEGLPIPPPTSEAGIVDIPDLPQGLRARIAQAFTYQKPTRKSRQTRPPEEGRTEADRLEEAIGLARRIRNRGWKYTRHKSIHENWWILLSEDQKKRIKEIAERYQSFQEMIDESLRGHIDFGTHDLVEQPLRKFRRERKIESDDIRRLLQSPIKERSKFANGWARDALKGLKALLEVQPYRPRVHQSKAEKDDDLWQRKILAFRRISR
jgi:predicted RNase H-like HicB family nuclease